jgi:lipopolysaccharide export system protein LptA
MSLSRNPWPILVRRSALGLLAAGGATAGYYGVINLLRTDAFASLRARDIAGFGTDTGTRMTDVELRQYRRGKLVAKTDAGELTMSRDGNTIELKKLRNGEYHRKDGQAKFAADRGTWDTRAERLVLSGKTRIADKDFDLNSSSVVIDQRKDRLVMPNAIDGRVKGGVGTAASLAYNMKTGAFEIGKAKWTGPLNGVQDLAGQANERTKWDVESARTVSGGSKTNTEVYTDARATDQEIIIKAPHIERNTKTDVLTATGRVFYYSAKSNFVADKIVVYRKEKRAVLSGTVIMLIKPKQKVPEGTVIPPKEEEITPFRPVMPDQVNGKVPSYGPSKEEKELDEKLRDGKTVREFPIVVTATDIVYWYGKGQRRADITGSPQARQEFTGGRWRHVWTKTAKYDGEAETLLLQSTENKRDTIYKNSIGDNLTAISFLISTKDEDDSYSGEGITGSVFQDSEDDPRDKKKTPPPTTGGGTTGGRIG